MKRGHGLAPYLFLAPAVLVFSVFVIYPFGSSVATSFTDWNGLSDTSQFIGFANYLEIAQDPVFWISIRNNLVWMLVMPTVTLSVGLLVAIVLFSRPVGFTIFRTAFFLPQVLGPAIVGVIWLIMYQPRRGALAELGDASGLAFLEYSYLGDPATALGAILVAEFWFSMGFFMVVFLSGLQSVDTQLLDASKLDGAGPLQRFRHVILPQLGPVITLALVLALIGSLNVFDIIFTMTGGGPGNATEVLGTYTYTKAFSEGRIGYGAALTVIMALMALILSGLLMAVRRERR